MVWTKIDYDSLEEEIQWQKNRGFAEYTFVLISFLRIKHACIKPNDLLALLIQL